MGVVAAGSLIVGAVTAYGQKRGGDAADDIAARNAAVAEEEGRAAKKKAEFDEALHRERVRQALSTQRAAVGASGIELSGSAALGLEESAMQGELDALVIRHGGEIEQQRAASAAGIERAIGKDVKKASRIGAGTTLLTSGSRFVGEQMKRREQQRGR
jgi:hypothetical protein